MFQSRTLYALNYFIYNFILINYIYNFMLMTCCVCFGLIEIVYLQADKTKEIFNKVI